MEIVNKNPKVYIIAGKARHGKSTVSEIIKDYYTNQLGLKIIDIAYGRYIKTYVQNVSDWDGSDDTKPRTLMQILGTDVIRGKVNPNFYANRIIEDITIYSYFVDAIIISDARYPDEIDVPKNNFKNAISIHVVNPNIVSDLTDKEKQHASETGLDNYHNYDYEIINDQDLETLKNKVIKIIKEIEHES